MDNRLTLFNQNLQEEYDNYLNEGSFSRRIEAEMRKSGAPAWRDVHKAINNPKNYQLSNIKPLSGQYNKNSMNQHNNTNIGTTPFQRRIVDEMRKNGAPAWRDMYRTVYKSKPINDSYNFKDHLFIPLTEAPILQNKQKRMPLNHNTLSKYEERRGISNLGTQRYSDQETYYRGQDAQNFARGYAARYSGYSGNNNYYY